MVFDDKQKEKNDEFTDQQAVWLKTPNASYLNYLSMKLNALETMIIGSAANCSLACLNNSECDSFEYSYKKSKNSYKNCVLYNVTSKENELYIGGISTNVTDHYDLEFKPEPVPDKILKILDREFEFNDVTSGLGIASLIFGFIANISKFLSLTAVIVITSAQNTCVDTPGW